MPWMSGARRLSRWLLAGVALLGARRAVAEAPAPTVVGIEVRSDVAVERPQEVLGAIAVAPGEPLAPEAVARSLRNLNASGRAGSIEAWAVPAPGGVRLVFVLGARVVVREVVLEGELGLREEDLRAAIVQAAGQPLYEDRVFRSVYRLQDLLAERGYLDAGVRVDVDEHAEDRTTTVRFRVASGEPATVGAIAFDGDLGPFAPSRLLEPLRGKPGARYRVTQTSDDADRLERWLLQQGHRTALVGKPQVEYRSEERLVDLTYPVQAGPRVTFEIEGADRARLEKAGVLAPLLEGRYDEALALATVDAIRTHLQSQGHYEAEIAFDEERLEGERRVRYRVVPGPLYALDRVELTGNEAFPAARLRALMQTSPSRLLGAGGGRLVDAWLADDLANLRSFYALQGYGAVEVGPPQIEKSGGRLAVTVPIREGPRRTVAELAVEGNESVASGALLADLPLAPGGPFHPRLLEAALDEMRARYEERGYNAAQVVTDLAWSGDETLVAVRFRVLEGPQNVVDRVVVRGYQRTDPELIRIAARLSTGEAVNRQRLLEAQRQLYSLGIFSRVEVTLVPGTPYTGGRDVLVRVEEGKRRRITYGAGFDSEDGVRGLFGYSQGNLFGRAMRGRLDLQASTNDRQARLLFEQPYLWRRPLPVTYSLFGIEEERESFDSERYGGQVEVRRLRERWRLGLLGTYKFVESDVDPDIEPLDVTRELQDVRILSLTPNLLVERRDDPVDPTSGWSSSLQTEFALAALEAEAQFSKLFGQQTGYLGVGRLGVIAGSLRLGAIEPGSEKVLGEIPDLPADSDELPSESIPISERFFAGGRATHRAYERDLLGIVGETLLRCPSEGRIFVDPVIGPRPATCSDPLDADDRGRLVPVGGNGLLLLNLDYRFPIVGAFGGTVFVDAGNVWADWRSIDLSQIKTGAGVGVRYRTPIGPLRLEIGWKLDREEGEDPYEVSLSFGNPF